TPRASTRARPEGPMTRPGPPSPEGAVPLGSTRAVPSKARRGPVRSPGRHHRSVAIFFAGPLNLTQRQVFACVGPPTTPLVPSQPSGPAPGGRGVVVATPAVPPDPAHP